MKRITVLKSLRTRSGADDWLRLMRKQFPDAQIMDTDALKGFPDIAYTVDPVGFDNHIVIEEDLSPIIEKVKEGEIGAIVAALVNSGYAKVDNYGFCFTEKWDNTLQEFMSMAFERGLDSYKSTSKLEVPSDFTEFMTACYRVLKAAGAPDLPTDADVPENNETGEEPEAPTAISDGEAIAAHLSESAPEAETVPEGLDKEEVEGAAIEAQSTPDTTKSLAGTVFKSLGEARMWEKTADTSKYYIDPIRFDEKREHGTRFTHIVREKQQSEPVGAFGNRRRKK